MKKVILSFIFTMGVLSTQSVFAQGLYITGNVFANATSLSGSMNNRWNTAATTATTYIYATSNATPGSSISFAGRGSDGTFFSCFVPITSALYNASRDIKNNLGNAGYLRATKTTTSSECTSVYHFNSSYYLN